MRYLDYFIKCIIRNFVRLFLRPISIVILFLIVFVLFMFVDSVFASESLAVGTPNYEVWNDKAFNSLGGGKVSVISYNGLHGRAVYFKPNIKGILNLGFSSNEFHEAKFVQDTVPTLNDEGFDYYYTDTSGYIYFDTTIGTYNQTGYWLVYYSVDLTSQNPTYSSIDDYSNSGVINAQQQTTQAIQQQTNVINSINSSLTDSTVDNNAINIDVSDLDFDDSQGIDSFFTNFINNIKDVFSNISNEVETIEIPLPYTDNKLVLSSDLLSKHIVNTSLYNLIQVFWWFLIGSYIIVFCRRIIVWFTSGEIAERGPSSFIRYLDKNNEIIKTYMM